MGPATRDEVGGLEFDWLAVDAVSHIAFFSTAGTGYVPDGALGSIQANDEAIDVILARPPSVPALFAPELPANVKNVWRMMAERGLFAYDGDPTGGPYRLVAAPATAAEVLELPAPAAEVARLVQLHGLRFSERRVISAELLQTAVHGNPG